MSFINKIIKKQNAKEMKLQHGVNTVQSIIEETDSQKEAARKAVNAAIEEIQSHPEMPVGEFMKRLQQNTDLSDADLVKIIKQLPDVKSEEATVAAVKYTDLPSQAIAEIIEDAPISPVVAKEIADEIPDEEIQKEQQNKIDEIIEEEERQKAIAVENKLLDELSQIYNNCETLETPQLVAKISSLIIPERTQKINNKLLDIIAKRTAFDCMEFGCPRIPSLTAILPSEDMLEANLPLLTQKEYNKFINETNGDTNYPHDYGIKEKKLIKMKLLDDIAKKSAETFDKIGDFNLPQIEQLHELTQEELDTFANTVKTYSTSLDDIDEQRLVRQLNGDSFSDLQDLNKMLEKMTPRVRDLTIKNIITSLKQNTNGTRTELQKNVDEELLDITLKLRSLPVNKQLATAKAINTALDQQQEAIKMWRNHKKNVFPQSTTPSTNDEQGR